MATVYRTALIVSLCAEGRSDLAVLELHSIPHANGVGSARSNRQSAAGRCNVRARQRLSLLMPFISSLRCAPFLPTVASRTGGVARPLLTPPP